MKMPLLPRDPDLKDRLGTDCVAPNLEAWAQEDFRLSAIPQPLMDANVQILSGEDALAYLLEDKVSKMQRVSSYITKPVQQLLSRYDHLKAGIWATTYGVPYAKPIHPRMDPYKFSKRIKYETPPGASATPILPHVDKVTAAAIYQRYHVQPLPGQGFWDVVELHGLPVALTEGLKKALSLIAHGIPAIALRGVTQWHLKGTPELHPEIAQLATQGRKLYIVFDQDTKPKTIANVQKQVWKLGAALETNGCRVFCPVWEPELGKGVDDVLYRQGETAQDWLAQLLKTAPTLKAYKRDRKTAATLDLIERLNTLTFPIERDTEGEYLPELPPLTPGAIHVVDATMNTGKTYRIGRDWVQTALQEDKHVLVLSPLNSLGQQTAKDWGILHIHDQGANGESQRNFWEAARKRAAIVLCPDSIGKLPEWFWTKPLVLIVDEGNQVTEHICQGDTLKSRYGAVLERIASAAKHAIASGGAIVLSEDGIPDRAVTFWQTISEATAVRCLRHRKQGIPWSCTVYTGAASGFRQALLSTISQGDRILFVTASQREAKRVERVLKDHYKVIRIDSETNENGAFNLFFKAPDQWLSVHQPEVLILSPSAKSGVSIEGRVTAEEAYFTEVWGYFPALSTDTHLQLLGRYRPPVPRRLFVPPFILGTGDELHASPKRIKRRLQNNIDTLAQVFELTPRSELEKLEVAILDYLAVARAASGRQKSIAQDALIARLEASGHQVSTLKVEGVPPITQQWKDIQDEIWQEEAQEIAQVQVESGQDSNWAHRTLDSMESSREARIIAHKVLWREAFPGVLFDDPDEVYQAITKDYGSMRRGVLLQAQAMNLEAVKASDRTAAESILNGSVRAAHRLPKTYIRAAMIHRLGVLALMDGQSWSNRDRRCIAIKRMALKYADEIQYWLRLTIKPEQTPSEIANKLLRKLGLEAVSTARPGKRTETRNRVYSISDFENSVRCKLLVAACSRLSESVSTVCNKAEGSIRDEDTPPKNVVKWAVGMVARCLKTGRLVLVEAIEETVATVSNELGALVQIPVSELEALVS